MCIRDRVTFGAPNPGGVKLAEALRGVTVRQYRHVGDPVPDLPGDPFRRVAPLHELGRQLRLFGSHELQSYVEALSDGQELAAAPT